jgi:CMP-N,N'-diacetyllegionaminic acid synthase
MPEIVGIVPARAGSQGIKNKNLLHINKKHIIDLSLDTLRESFLIDHIAISTNIRSILERSWSGVKMIKRPDEYALNESPIDQALIHAVTELESQEIHPDIVVWLQPNVPIRETGIVDKVLTKLLDDKYASAAVTCKKLDPRIAWAKKMSPMGYLQPVNPDCTEFRRQNLDDVYLADGSVVAFYRNNLEVIESSVHGYLGENVLPIIQEDDNLSLELDEKQDLVSLYNYLTREQVEDSDLENYFGLKI